MCQLAERGVDGLTGGVVNSAAEADDIQESQRRVAELNARVRSGAARVEKMLESQAALNLRLRGIVA